MIGYHHLRDRTAVPIGLVADDIDLPAKHEARKVLLGALTKRLFLLRGIDPGDPDLVLLILGIQNGYRVTVTDANDPAG